MVWVVVKSCGIFDYEMDDLGAFFVDHMVGTNWMQFDTIIACGEMGRRRIARGGSENMNLLSWS